MALIQTIAYYLIGGFIIFLIIMGMIKRVKEEFKQPKNPGEL